MAGFGYIDSDYAFIDLGPNIDMDYVRGLETRAGLSVDGMLNQVAAAMGAINGTLDPLVQELVYPTTNVVGGRRRTTQKQIKRAGEYTVPRPQRGKSVRNMLPITSFDVAMGFTEEGLQTISAESFRDEVQDIVDAWQRLYVQETLSALFDPTPVMVDTDLETGALSPRFAGSGTGDNAFTGFYPNGQALPGGYTHYGFSTEAAIATAVRTYRDRLKRWHRGPFDLIASDAFVALLQADTANFVSAGSMLVRPGANEQQTILDPNVYLGSYLGDIRVRAGREELGDTAHAAIYKSYGNFSPQNPLAWRYDPLYGRAAWIRSREMFPLSNAFVKQRFGIGVSDRTSAVLLYVDDAAVAYEPPSIIA